VTGASTAQPSTTSFTPITGSKNISELGGIAVELPCPLEEQGMDVELFLQSLLVDGFGGSASRRFMREMADQLFKVAPKTTLLTRSYSIHRRLRQ